MGKKIAEGSLRLWWIPQVPLRNGNKPFTVRVKSVDEAELLADVLADYDLYQYNTKIKPDYSNAGGLDVYEDGEWTNWYSDEGEDFDEYLARRRGE